MPLTKSTLLFAIAAFTAHADLVQTVPFSFLGSSSGPVQQTISVPQFDPAQGTLNAVMLTIFPSFQFIFDVFDTGAGPVSVTASDTVSFNGAPIPSRNSSTPIQQTSSSERVRSHSPYRSRRPMSSSSPAPRCRTFSRLPESQAP